VISGIKRHIKLAVRHGRFDHFFARMNLVFSRRRRYLASHSPEPISGFELEMQHAALPLSPAAIR
jgi:hypothetical protein